MPPCYLSFTHLSVLYRISSDFDTVRYFSRNTEILEEPLMCRPELSPHGFLHPLFRLDEVRAQLELCPSIYPLQENNSMNSN